MKRDRVFEMTKAVLEMLLKSDTDDAIDEEGER
jgi:hypothetical protein